MPKQLVFLWEKHHLRRRLNMLPPPHPRSLPPMPRRLRWRQIPSKLQATTMNTLIEVEEAAPPAMRLKRRDVKLERLEFNLARARAAIRFAAQNPNKTFSEDRDYVPVRPVYRNPYAFHRSYLEMEKLFRVYVYEEGEPLLFHDGPCRNIYSMEGRFIYNMEIGNRFRTRDPDRALVHFLPFSVVKMVKYIYKPKSFDLSPLKRTILDYINVISSRYPYWNRSLGADHFMLSCHDWGALQCQHIGGFTAVQRRVASRDQPQDGAHDRHHWRAPGLPEKGT